MRWETLPLPESSRIDALQKSLGVPRVVATLLVQRGIDDFAGAKNFFRPKWDDLHDPFLMKDMTKAVERVNLALSKQEKIMVYGDYDVDGTTSVALMTSFLKANQGRIIPYIPDRYSEGYGLSKKGIDVASQQGVSLIIALDCGIKAIEKVLYAQTQHIDVIICDHHLPGEELPPAVAILDPKRSDCSYPFDELCGCGIGFKLIQGIAQKKGISSAELHPYLDLVATAIAADIVPIVGENRTLSFFGIEQLRAASRKAFRPLLGELKKPVNVTDLVFKVAPRINAAGRMEHALTAAHLLMATELDDISRKAEQIEGFNSERRLTDERITAEALQQIDERKEEGFPATVVYSDHWHKGVVGIVASRLIETHYRPTVVLTRSGDHYVGSVRSVKGFDVYAALLACQGHLLQFGGHKYAAGLTLERTQLQAFKKAFESEVSQTLLPTQKTPSLLYDLELPIDQIEPKLYRIIEQMAPFGPKNMRPVFCSFNCVDSGETRVVGKENTHLRLSIKTPKGVLTGIGFNLAQYCSAIQKGQPFDLLYTLDQNEWNGRVSLQLRVKDIKIRA
ncbi:MAG: single-stranded-DNA-specific exonuclease RecJ [Flavobacteriaceae bacterium]